MLYPILISLFIFWLPFQSGLHFWPFFSYIYGVRCDYLSPTLYLTDLVFFALFAYAICTKKLQISFREKKLSFFLFLILAFVNILVASSPPAAFFKWLIVFKLYLVFLFFKNLDIKNLSRILTCFLGLSFIVVSLVAIIQLFNQKTSGNLFYLLGERSFSVNSPGVALFHLANRFFLRPYSTFSHPNSLAGFLGLFIFLFFFLMGKRDKNKIWSGNNIFLLLPFFLMFASLSLNAIAAFLTASLFYLLLRNKFRLMKKLFIVLTLTLIVFSFLQKFILDLPILSPLLKDRSFSERKYLMDSALVRLSQKPFLGWGLNNSFYKSPSFQPVHNIYLLAAIESGLIGLIALYGLLIFWLQKIKAPVLIGGLMFVLITGFFDHYWLTLQQNQMFLAVFLGLSLNRKLFAKI